MAMKGRSSEKVSLRWIILLCISFFVLGMLFENRIWFAPESNNQIIKRQRQEQELQVVSEEHVVSSSLDSHQIQNFFTSNLFSLIVIFVFVQKVEQDNDIVEKVYKTKEAVQSLDKSISTLQMELTATRSAQEMARVGNSLIVPPALSSREGPPKEREGLPKEKAFVVIGINTAFSSRKKARFDQRDLDASSATSKSILDRAIDSEESQHKDFLRLEHVEGYHELSAKTKIFFSTVVAKWDAEFYVKVDDDVHVNLGALATTLARHRSSSRVYIGCMKSGPVLAQKNVKYHEPEYWKFGEEGNKYFRHATGQIYAISRDLANYISINQPILHQYANEDVSLGAWFIGLEIEHIDDHNMCCGTPPDCEWKAQAGNVCVASFDWSCSGICRSVERIKDVHARCGEGDGAGYCP
ncbi:beta-1,3-galactosyltransferase 7 [Cinnamomum micranthum f. kanehirae]|uniref:Hexosyltransferase n=1 Tax=Cinnamomum micranthum f. kanehirae TaxID=337451 RepID=A0A443PHB9_9MAGN|nr:beta-1,3-galactosyltransferase 7 [Cinnamomum micranthum f. kanehirae]